MKESIGSEAQNEARHEETSDYKASVAFGLPKRDQLDMVAGLYA